MAVISAKSGFQYILETGTYVGVRAENLSLLLIGTPN